MKSLRSFFLTIQTSFSINMQVLLLFSICGAVSAATYFVSPDGSASNPGTFEEPFGSLEKGVKEASSGDTVFFRGGTYNVKAGITITKTGKSDAERVFLLAYEKERPVFDFSETTRQDNGVTFLNCNWLYVKGLEFCNVPQLGPYTPNCVLVERSAHITFDQCSFHHNGGTGLFISRGTGGHLVLNCDSHNNYDPLSGQGDGQNADGFGVHYQDPGTDTTIIRGCRGWWNSDDGIDCIHQNTAVIFENSWFWLNGYKPGSLERPLAGNGQGIKAGGYDLPPNKIPPEFPQNIVRNCISFFNGDRGLNANYHPVPCKWYNNTSFGNRGGNVFMEGIDYHGGSSYTRGVNKAILRNNISFKGSVRNCDGPGIDASNNSWDIPGFEISEDDFVSIDTAGVFGPRKEDGSLPDIDFLKLAKESDLIDAGEDIGYPFTGKAPDVGAFEYMESSGSIILINQPDNKLTVVPLSYTYTRDILCDLTGRSLPNTTANRSYQVYLRTSETVPGTRHNATILHLR